MILITPLELALKAEAIKDTEPRVDLESIYQEENLSDTFNVVKEHIDANRVNNSHANPK